MENNKDTRRKNPKIAETPIDIKTPRGALHEAFLVSSDRWAEASYLRCVSGIEIRGNPCGEVIYLPGNGILAHQHATNGNCSWH
jgi:hypothetical protein